MLVSEYLERLRQYGDAPAITWSDTTVTYAELLAEIDRVRSQLARAGVRAGEVVAFAGDHSPLACAMLLGLAAEGAIVVPLSRRAMHQPDELFATAEVQVVISTDDHGDLQATRRPVTVTNPLLRTLQDRGNPGMVIFTSASTGQSKAVLHDFTSVLERYRQPRRAMRVLAFLLFDHTGGINTVLHTLGHGGTLVGIEQRTPDGVCETVEKHRVELLPATPTFLNMMLIAQVHTRHDLSSLKLISYGTEVMPQATLTRLAAAFPGVALQQTYGLTEVGVMRSISAEPGSRWVRVGGEGYETKVVDGTLRVRTRYAMMGYLNAPSPIDAEGWLDTHDRVEVRGDEIIVLGRDSDIINVGGEKVYPAEIEAVLLEMPNVKDATVFGHRNPVMGNIVAARLVLDEAEPVAELRQRVRAFCEPRLARYKIPLMIEIVDSAAVGERYKKLRPR